ncbi:TetR/AcrR family transcriptional regulator [Kineosporia rhizophila]|uniref:TetR/AcrR family transcriptional regulator n=1 Tax=Kineosporia TaxID=49184 RepID=UPI000A4922C4|nr:MULTISPECIES: TetR/AcrR family transcriptional regulator [Kineosporia]MCE0538551.1 TetR/AcrR family transcriptional regulator [Kineosporia rhizophila]GLY19653.1 TetR family transcriptional regulator [Kineosporia sp. NBRC 101677]
MTTGATAVGPRERLLEAASRLFYAEGINAVGVDRVLQQANVTRASMYRHFSGKEELVVAYLKREDVTMHQIWDEALAQAVSADHKLELAIEGIADDAMLRHTLGCPFIKAAGEFPDPAGPVRQVVTQHRAWFHHDLLTMLTEAGREDVELKASALAMLRDSLLVGSFLDDRQGARKTFVRTARWMAGLR